VSEPSRPIGFDLPLAAMIALLAVGAGAYYAERTLPEAPPPRPAVRAAATTGDWFADFRTLDASFASARRAGAFTQPTDAIITGSVPAKAPAAKADRTGPAAPSRPKAAIAPAADGRQAYAGASAKAAAFGALAPAPWLRMRVEATAKAAPAPRPGRTAELPLLPPVKPVVASEAADAGLAYAQPESRAEAPFRSLFKPGSEEGTVEVPANLPRNMHQWAYAALKGDVWDKKQQRCLAEAIYFEARGESERGQAAVGQVVLNRVRNPAYPDTICAVVYQNSSWIDACQFSFACDGRKEVITEPEAWRRAQRIAADVTAGRLYDRDVADATHYHAYWVRPSWRDTMKRVATIGVHRFYRTYGGGWI
jgi:spore germination cell wall hydrolase CwlJ-like protein